ncbi:unnamed protein product [Sympodiomycopsis kandeliae]
MAASLSDLQHQMKTIAAFDGSTTPTADLRHFLQSFFKLQFSNSFYHQVYAITAIISTLVVMGLAVVVRRLYEGNFWLVRIQEAADSRYPLVIPNSVLSFVFVEAIFGVIYVVYLWCQMAEMRWDHDLGGAGYWILPVWIVLFYGAWFGAVGTFYASPGILSRRKRISRRWDIAKFIPSPIVCNQLFIGVPIFNTISVMIVAIIFGRSYHISWDHMTAFDRQLALQPAEAHLTAEQKQMALELWTMFMDTWRYVYIGFNLWGAWAFLLLCLYAPAGGHLLQTLRTQIAEQRTFGKIRSRPTIADVSDTSSDGDKRANSQKIVPSGQAPIWKSDRRVDTITISQGDQEAQVDDNRVRILEAQHEATRAAESVFYPPIKASRVSVSQGQSHSNLQALRSAARNIVIMWTTISSAVLIYGALCLVVANQIKGVIARGPDDLVSWYETYNLIAGWVACVFGGLNFVWVTSRTFEPVLDGLQLKYAAGSGSPRGTLTTFFTSSRPNLGRPISRSTGQRREDGTTLGRTMDTANPAVLSDNAVDLDSVTPCLVRGGGGGGSGGSDTAWPNNLGSLRTVDEAPSYGEDTMDELRLQRVDSKGYPLDKSSIDGKTMLNSARSGEIRDWQVRPDIKYYIGEDDPSQQQLHQQRPRYQSRGSDYSQEEVQNAPLAARLARFQSPHSEPPQQLQRQVSRKAAPRLETAP